MVCAKTLTSGRPNNNRQEQTLETAASAGQEFRVSLPAPRKEPVLAIGFSRGL